MSTGFLLRATRVVSSIVQYILLGLLIAYFAGMFFWRDLGALHQYEKQLLAATLFWMVLFTITQASSTRNCENALGGANVTLVEIHRMISLMGEDVEVKALEDDQVYEATRLAVESSKKRVWVSYLRSQGPAQRTAAARHVDACRLWAMKHESHRFRRIILDSGGEWMSDFLKAELETVRKAKAKGRMYGVKVLADSRHSSEAFSIGIYDDLVILTYAVDSHRLVGVKIRSNQAVDKFFRFYYESLWNSSTAVEIEKHRPTYEIVNGSPR